MYHNNLLVIWSLLCNLYCTWSLLQENGPERNIYFGASHGKQMSRKSFLITPGRVTGNGRTKKQKTKSKRSRAAKKYQKRVTLRGVLW